MSGCRCVLNTVILFLWCHTWVDVICIWGVALVLICSNVLIINLRQDRCSFRITLQMMYEKLKMIKQVSGVLESVVLINYFWKDDRLSFPWCKLVLKTENMINEDKWERSTNLKWELFYEWSKYVFWFDPPMKKIENHKMRSN